MGNYYIKLSCMYTHTNRELSVEHIIIKHQSSWYHNKKKKGIKAPQKSKYFTTVVRNFKFPLLLKSIFIILSTLKYVGNRKNKKLTYPYILHTHIYIDI